MVMMVVMVVKVRTGNKALVETVMMMMVMMVMMVVGLAVWIVELRLDEPRAPNLTEQFGRVGNRVK